LPYAPPGRIDCPRVAKFGGGPGGGRGGADIVNLNYNKGKQKHRDELRNPHPQRYPVREAQYESIEAEESIGCAQLRKQRQR